jgi:hypothetical protein
MDLGLVLFANPSHSLSLFQSTPFHFKQNSAMSDSKVHCQSRHRQFDLSQTECNKRNLFRKEPNMSGNTISGSVGNIVGGGITDLVKVYCTPARSCPQLVVLSSNGNFSFPNLSPGTYIISAVPDPRFPICTLIQAVPNTAQTLTLSSVAIGSGGIFQGVYTGTITGGANNAFAGYQFVVAGFVNSQNNGTFFCIASTTTTLTLAGVLAFTESHAATATSVATNTGYFGNLGINAVGNIIVGVSPVISGFGHSVNNGTFPITSSDAAGFAVANVGAAETTGSAQAVISQYNGWVFRSPKVVTIDPNNPQDQTGINLESTPPNASNQFATNF